MVKRALLVVAVVVVAVGVAMVAFRLGRGTTSADPAGTPSASSSSSVPGPPASGPASPAPSPYDSSPALPKGPVVAGEGGAGKGPAGLPLGYQHSPDGAAAAATNYFSWFLSKRMVDDTTRQHLIDAMAADTNAKAVLQREGTQVAKLFKGANTAESQPTRGAYAISTYNAEKAGVLVWLPYVVTGAPAESGMNGTVWGQYLVPLVWAGGDWKLPESPASKLGSVGAPANPEGNPTPQEKYQLLHNPPVDDPGELPDAYRAKWMEYQNAAR